MTCWAALDEMDEQHQTLRRAAWHIDRDTEDACDLFASDGVHPHFSALRGRLIGLVEGVSFVDSPVVTWSERDGEIDDVVTTRSLPLTDWLARDAMRGEAHDAALGLISRIRAELQGRPDSRVFMAFRLDR